MEIGQIIRCKITGVQPYGVFVEYEDFQGLIHISEVSDRYVSDITKLFSNGDLVDAVIIALDQENKKLQLSYKKAHKVNPDVAKQVDIKIGFRSLESKIKTWIDDKREK